MKPGDQHGRLTIESEPFREGKHRRVWVTCSCGKRGRCKGYAQSIESGHSTSCGCLRAERVSEACSTHGLSRGEWKVEFKIWRGMVARCTDRDHPFFHHYGGRGITICERWTGENGAAAFISDMGKRPSKDQSLERLDNDGPYSPENCVWATRKEQARNKRTTRLVTFRGQTKSLAAWAEELGMKWQTLYARVGKWSVEEAFTRPVRKPGQRPKESE